jgi:hypothetical protein
MTKTKLAQRQTYSNGHIVSVGLTGNVGYISIEDNKLYPDEDSRAKRRDLGYNIIMMKFASAAVLAMLASSVMA